MIDTPDTNTIQSYLDTLKCCMEDAQRKLDEVRTASAAADNIYFSKKAYFEKLKSYWEKLKETNEKGRQAKQSVSVAIDAADKLKTGVELDRDAIECLVKEITELSENLEIYRNCVDTLIKCIEAIKSNKLNKGNSIITGLTKLRDCYDEAITAATTAVGNVLDLLECAFILKYKLAGKGSNSIYQECKPPMEMEDPCKKSQKIESPEIDCLTADGGSDPFDEDFFKGLCKALEQLREDVCSQFELYTTAEDGKIDFRCDYAKGVKDEMDLMEQEVESALCCKEAIEKELSKYESANQAAIRAYQAALEAKKC